MTLAEETDMIARLQALPENRILDYFWMVYRNGDSVANDTLELLSQMGRVHVLRPVSWNPAVIRKEHERGARSSYQERKCFACHNTKHRLYSHHVLEVYHGGSNDPRNQVPLCFICHQKLHPWLTVEPEPYRVKGFESLYRIAKRVLHEISGEKRDAAALHEMYEGEADDAVS